MPAHAEPSELVARGAEQVDVVALVLPSARDAARHVIDDTQHGDHGGRVDGHVARLVVERDVAARDGDLEFEASVGKPLDGLAELPHDLGVLGRAEVQAVAHRNRCGTRGRNVAERLGEGELRAAVRVEVAVAAVGVGRDREAEAALLVDAHHAAVVGEAQRRVAEHVLVVLVGDPGLVCEVRRAEQGEQVGAQVGAAGETVGGVGLQRVDPRGVGDGAVVHRSVDGDRARLDVDDLLAAPVDDQAAGVGDLAENARLDIPLRDHREEALELLGGDDRHHALLALRHEDLLGRERGVAQQHLLEVDEHAAVAVGGELGGCARDASGAQVLDALHETQLEQLEAALDEHLLGERVAHLHRGALGGSAGGEAI